MPVTCVKLQSRVTSSGTTVNNWMIWFDFSYYYYCCYCHYCCCGFVCLFFICLFFDLFVVLAIVGLFVDVCFQVCIVVVIVLGCFCFCFLVCLFSFMKGNAVFISMGAGTGWSYNLLVSKLTFLILELYINYSVAGKFRCN